MAASPPLTPDSSAKLPTYTDSPAPALPPTNDSQNAGIASALARFEYEAGHTSVATGTKVLLIEWEDGEEVRGRGGEWAVEWKGRKQTLVAEEGGRTPADADADFGEIKDNTDLPSRSQSQVFTERPTHRLYFILPLGTPVPPNVTISFTPSSSPPPPSSSPSLQSNMAITIPTLPAIFPPSLLTTGTAQGKKGVLHTLWAKSRLHALRSEIAGEQVQNPEGESDKLKAAKSEHDWICDNFGIGERAGEPADQRPSANTPYLSTTSSTLPATSPYPATPVSPGGSERFLSKMRGLRVGTSESSWTAGPTAAQLAQPTPPHTDSSNAAARNPLSPEAGDVAVGSFAALKGPPIAATTTSSSSSSVPHHAPSRSRAAVPIAPPEAIASAQRGAASMAGMAALGSATAAPPQRKAVTADEDDGDDALFALPISPRSPDMAKSPFSWDPADVRSAVAAAAASANSRG